MISVARSWWKTVDTVLLLLMLAAGAWYTGRAYTPARLLAFAFFVLAYDSLDHVVEAVASKHGLAWLRVSYITALVLLVVFLLPGAKAPPGERECCQPCVAVEAGP